MKALLIFWFILLLYGTYKVIFVIMENRSNKLKEEYKKAVSILFLRWLKEQDAYNKFKSNIKNVKYLPTNIWWPIHHCKTLEAYLEYVNYMEYIKRAFQWNLTPQTEKYWNTLDLKWLNFLDLNNVKYASTKQIFQLAKNLNGKINNF